MLSETQTQWKSESVTNRRTNGPTYLNLLTGVGARVVLEMLAGAFLRMRKCVNIVKYE